MKRDCCNSEHGSANPHEFQCKDVLPGQLQKMPEIEGIAEHHNVRRTDNEVHHITGVVPDAKDQLDGIFEVQGKFMEQLGVPCLQLEQRAPNTILHASEFVKMLTSFTQTCTTALACETTELLDALPWKPWKKSHDKVDLNNVHIEIVDMMHFVVEIALIWGLDSRTLFQLYMKKMQENIDRQNKGY